MHTLHHLMPSSLSFRLRFPGRELEELLGVGNERSFLTPHTFKHTIKFVCIINARARYYVKRKVSRDEGSKKKNVHEEEDKAANAIEK